MLDHTKEKERVILKAARERFAHFGFSKVTMDEIAKDVDMGKASLYYYFPTKESVFRSVIQQEQNHFIEVVDQILAKNISVSQKLSEYVEKRLEVFQDLLNLGTLHVHSYFDAKSIYQNLFDDFHNQELMIMKKLFLEGKKKGEFKKSTSKDAPQLLLHVLQGLRIRILRKLKGAKSDTKHLNQLKNEMSLFINIFLEGIKA